MYHLYCLFCLSYNETIRRYYFYLYLHEFVIYYFYFNLSWNLFTVHCFYYVSIIVMNEFRKKYFSLLDLYLQHSLTHTNPFTLELKTVKLAESHLSKYLLIIFQSEVRIIIIILYLLMLMESLVCPLANVHACSLHTGSITCATFIISFVYG